MYPYGSELGDEQTSEHYSTTIVVLLEISIIRPNMFWSIVSCDARSPR